ncbi:hypothetical protein [Segetibacter koreensis]|uniref:hypothetical protein n=1 Tax=Segetibacter koreensis TaxID=398037 RepID=UPI00036FB820|nr:hypothetical protein [Segetibacter koreensis]
MIFSPIKVLTVATLVFLADSSFSQYTYYKPTEGFGIEVSLSNTNLKRMPMYRNSIASLAVIGDNIIGGTAADEKLAPYLFVASLNKKELIELKDLNEVVKGQRSIQSGFFKGKNNTLFAGTIANKLENGTTGSGHILQVNIGTNANISITDLGTPVRGEGVNAITGDEKANMLYGITYPSGIFFSYNIASKTFKTYKEVAPTKAQFDTLVNEYHEKPEEFLSSSLAVDNKGLVYGSRAINKVFYFNPSDESFHTVSDLPEVWGRRTLGRVDAWTKSSDGSLYGGNGGDGQLFQLDASTNNVKNLGKPIMMNRLRSMCFGANGKLYGIAGALPGYAHLFSYEPKNEGFKDLGNPQFILKAPGIEQGIEWRGFQLRTITASEDGKYIVMGEDEALSQLLIFPVGD